MSTSAWEFVLYLIEILHQTTTDEVKRLSRFALYLIEILHQTTTTAARRSMKKWLYLIEILHQTTTLWLLFGCCLGCILLKFYIKPQHTQRQVILQNVVSY